MPEILYQQNKTINLYLWNTMSLYAA